MKLKNKFNLFGRINISRLQAIVFLALLCTFLVITNMQRPRVLILHSYETTLPWVKDVNEGISRVLRKEPFYLLKYHYMNTTPYRTDIKYLTKAGQSARQVIDRWNPNVVIAVDDEAQKYAAQFYANNSRIKLVFTGVNGKPEEYQYDKATNVTGLLEREPLDRFKDLFLQILPPEKRRIMHVSDTTLTSQSVSDTIRQFSWQPLQLVDSIKCKTFDDWKQAIRRAQQEADVMFITNYAAVKQSPDSDLFVPLKDITEWTEKNSTLPGISSVFRYPENGGMVALRVSPFEQGQTAGRMVVDIIKNRKSPSEIPIVSSQQFLVYLRGAKVVERNVNLPKVYEAFARALNIYYE